MELVLRPVTIEDADILLEWANDKETRAASFNHDAITMDTHLPWLKKKLSDENTFFYLACVDENPVGSIRLDKDDETGAFVISYSIGCKYRGQGLGNDILECIEEKAKTIIPGNTLVGEVLIGNLASQKCFINNGYEEIDRTDEKIVYSKKI